MIKLANEIINGRRLTRNDSLGFLITADLEDLCKGADMLRKHFCHSHADLCSIINARSGKCSENCRFCAQSAHHCTGIEEYGFLDERKILDECLYNEKKGVHRFSLVTAGRTLAGADFEKALDAYRLMKQKSRCQQIPFKHRDLTPQLPRHLHNAHL